jgi:hypothetical protein
MKIILTESQNESLKNKLMNVIDSAGFEMGVTVSGSFNNLLNIIGKDNLYDALVQSGFDTNKIEMITSKYDIPSDWYSNIRNLKNTLNILLNKWGPMYLLKIEGQYHPHRILFQPQGDTNLCIVEHIGSMPEEEFLKEFSLTGLDVNKVINLYFEGE